MGLLLLNLVVPAGSAGHHVQALKIPPVVRFRVIANSDSPVDQAVKLDVRDAVLENLEAKLTVVHSRKQALAVIASDRTQLDGVVRRVLSHLDVDYGATVSLTRTLFPTKVYGTWVLPAGQYDALLIKLGHADGHNWWCVLYPSLCFIDMTNGIAIPTAAIRQASSPSARTRPSHIRVSWRPPHFIDAIARLFGHV